MPYTTRELLARLIKCEAGGEGDDGMAAVASVAVSYTHLITAPNAERFLRPIPTGRNTAPLAANEFTESRKPKANADGEVER